MSWNILFYNNKVTESITALPKKIQARFFFLAERMKIDGPDLGMPHTRAMGDGLFEMRVKASEGIMRAFYCMAVKNNIIILHCFIKKTQKTPRKEFALAQSRLKEVKHV